MPQGEEHAKGKHNGVEVALLTSEEEGKYQD